MKHKYSEVVPFVYNRQRLHEVVSTIVKEHDLFNRPVPISALRTTQKKQILKTLDVEFGETLYEIYVNHVTIACLHPKQRSAIHVDKDIDNTLTTKALNIPVTECNDVIMNWYEVKPGGVTKNIRSARGWEIPGLSLDQSVLLYTQPASKPFLVNPSSFHDIVNNGNQQELIISIRTGNENWSG